MVGRGGASFCEPAVTLGIAGAPPSIFRGGGFRSGSLKIGVFEMSKSALLARAISFSLGNVGFSRNGPSFNVCCTSATSASDMNGLAIVATTFGNLLATAVISCTWPDIMMMGTRAVLSLLPMRRQISSPLMSGRT